MKSIRILSGQHKNRRINFPENDALRPPSHYIRQSIFNILIHRFFSDRVGQDRPLLGVKVLDLFAGTGSYGIESLSRGADRATFVESNYQTVHHLEFVLKDFNLSCRSDVLCRSFPCAISCAVGDCSKFDVIFIDPPYSQTREEVSRILQNAAPFLATNGVIILEHPLLVKIDDLAQSLTRTMGKKRTTFFIHKER